MSEIKEPGKEYALSGKEILQLTRQQCRVVSYPDLTQIHSIEELLSPFGATALLYLTKPSYGHWCCIVQRAYTSKKGEKKIQVVEFCDPYGMYPDDEFKWVNNESRDILMEPENRLSQLLLKWVKATPSKGFGKREVHFNEFPLQSLDKGVNTCGRWVVLRILFKWMTSKEFEHAFPNDNEVLKWTNWLADREKFLVTGHPSDSIIISQRKTL